MKSTRSFFLLAGAALVVTAAPQTQGRQDERPPGDPGAIVREVVAPDPLRDVHERFFQALDHGDVQVLQTLLSDADEACYFVVGQDDQQRALAPGQELGDWTRAWSDAELGDAGAGTTRIVSHTVLADGARFAVIVLELERARDGFLGQEGTPRRIHCTSVVSKEAEEPVPVAGVDDANGPQVGGAAVETDPTIQGGTLDPVPDLKIMHLHMSVDAGHDMQGG